MNFSKNNRFAHLLVLLLASLILRFIFARFLGDEWSIEVRIISLFVILGTGAIFVLRGTAKIIEETTEVLSERTKLAGGLLQSFGTAFPDMVLGIIAAIVSVRLRSTDYARAINFAIIAAATTFGSNIYNIGHGVWCIVRQNMANKSGKEYAMFPFIKKSGIVTPMATHKTLPHLSELDAAMDVSIALTLLTALVAVSMVLFGQIKTAPLGIKNDLYQLIRPVGIAVFILSIGTLYYFRKTKRQETPVEEIGKEEHYYRRTSTPAILFNLLLAGAAILFAAIAMVEAIEVFSQITHTPLVIAGVLAGMIGCLGEMIVVHNFTVNPKGRIGDAITGVAMDNIVTILGASLVAIMGGIFLGGNALILIFVIILSCNTLLIWQIAKLKNFFLVPHTRNLPETRPGTLHIRKKIV
ncbi:MAG: hypothetical protein G01um101433_801 [Parcubacteria group bacterium Gr01-1014_33]|nr:MAG: hypothetical protein G01um101433_801 [Parcubacteria group bacterium Gr01-1014_33]